MHLTTIKSSADMDLGTSVSVEFLYEDKSLKGIRLTNLATKESFRFYADGYYGVKASAERSYALVEKWVAFGTVNDTPVERQFDTQHEADVWVEGWTGIPGRDLTVEKRTVKVHDDGTSASSDIPF